MAWTPKVWVDRAVEFAGRRTLTAVPGQADTFDVARAEGTIFAVGDEPDAANLNAEFGHVKTELDAINTNLTANSNSFIFAYDRASASYGYKAGGADTFHPFKPAAQVIASAYLQGPGYGETLVTVDGISGYRYYNNIPYTATENDCLMVGFLRYSSAVSTVIKIVLWDVTAGTYESFKTVRSTVIEGTFTKKIISGHTYRICAFDASPDSFRYLSSSYTIIK